MASEYSVISSPVVNLTVSSTVNSFGSERRFPKDLTVGALKGKLELLTGATPNNMHLEVYDVHNNLICKLDNDDALLGSYQIDDGMRLHVVDKTAGKGEFEDVSKVEKYEMSSNDYDKRSDSVKAFKQKMKMGRFADKDPEEQKRLEEENKRKEEEDKEAAAKLNVGDRCEVKVPNQPTKRGTVKFVGETSFKPGLWAGIQYDEPLGKNDGSVQGKRYFDCPAKYGGFVKPQHVTVGDFPEEDLDFDDEEL